MGVAILGVLDDVMLWEAPLSGDSSAVEVSVDFADPSGAAAEKRGGFIRVDEVFILQFCFRIGVAASASVARGSSGELIVQFQQLAGYRVVLNSSTSDHIPDCV